MQHVTPLDRIRLVAGLSFAVLSAILFALTSSSLDALAQENKPAKKEQAKEKKKDKEKAEKPAPPKKADKPQKPVEEEEETAPKRSPVGSTRLAEEANKAPHPAIKKTFEDLAQPHDLIQSQAGTTWRIRPLTRRYDREAVGGVTFVVIGKDGREGERHTVTRSAIRTVGHYEDKALAEYRALMNSRLDHADGGGKAAVSRFQLLKAAETLLAEVLQFHEAAKQRKVREGNEWAPVEQQLRDELLTVRVGQVRALTADKQWQEAESLAARLYKDHVASRPLLEAIETLFVRQAEADLAQKNYAQARARLEVLERNFAGAASTSIEPVRRQLQDRAQELVRQGESLAQQKNYSRAIQLLEEAEQAWPRLPGLRELQTQFQSAYPVMRVGVRSLPSQVWPTTARTDAERMAVRLVFENLLELQNGPSARDGYAFKLGREQPRNTPDGWEFSLASDSRWSDGKPVTTDDIRRSAEIAVDPRSPYYDPLASEILQLHVEDAQRFRIKLARSHFDPLSLLTFPVVPARQFPAEMSPRSAGSAGAPVGTGPYIYRGRADSDAVFTANPHYRRPHVSNGPAIQEIRFVAYADAAAAGQALEAGKLHALLDITTKEKDVLERSAAIKVLTLTEPRDKNPPYLSNPRVYFLAPNHRRPHLQNADFRRAIGLAIERDKVLNEVFRGKDRAGHKPLNGPFPVNSWAYNAELPADPSRPDVARTHLQNAKGALGTIPSLSLKYAAADPSAAAACARIRAMLAAVEIPVTPQGVPAEALAAELAKDRPEFDLVYWHHDFDNEALSLWPLLARNDTGGPGRNFMGYVPDKEVEGLFREMHYFREFGQVRQKMRDLHKELLTKMVIIPLWQLDRHVALHRSLLATKMHPLWFFDDVELWRLEQR